MLNMEECQRPVEPAEKYVLFLPFQKLKRRDEEIFGYGGRIISPFIN